MAKRKDENSRKFDLQFEKKTITVFDQIRGIDRIFKQGDVVQYVGLKKGIVQEDFSVILEDGTSLPFALKNQPHKFIKI